MQLHPLLRLLYVVLALAQSTALPSGIDDNGGEIGDEAGPDQNSDPALSGGGDSVDGGPDHQLDPPLVGPTADSHCFLEFYKRGLNSSELLSCPAHFRDIDDRGGNCGGRKWYLTGHYWQDFAICQDMCKDCIDSAIQQRSSAVRCARRKLFSSCYYGYNARLWNPRDDPWGGHQVKSQADCDAYPAEC